mmetsp:Transcript_56279/g.167401  ORF Transcript_56279/g.167401 Transcript_56279/m.167401 type:complete len:202 (+) Transcript_56279:1133-1738(+)
MSPKAPCMSCTRCAGVEVPGPITPTSAGSFMKSVMSKDSSGFSYSRVKSVFGPEPPPGKFLAETIRFTLLSSGSVPAAWKALFSHAAPYSGDSNSCGVLGIGKPYMSPLRRSVARRLASFMLGAGWKGANTLTGLRPGAATSQAGRRCLGTSPDPVSSSGPSSSSCSGSGGLGSSHLTKRSLSVSLMFTQPSLGPVPVRSS